MGTTQFCSETVYSFGGGVAQSGKLHLRVVFEHGNIGVPPLPHPDDCHGTLFGHENFSLHN